MSDMDPAENAGHVWHDTRGPESACKSCGLYYAQWNGGRCPKAPDCDASFAPGVDCDRELGHSGEHRAEVVWGPPSSDDEELSTHG